MLERLVARSYRAINRRDLAAVMRYWADDAVFEFPGRMPISGRFVGKAAIEAWWQRVFDRMATFHLTPRRVAFSNPLALTWANTMFVELEVEAMTKDGLRVRTDLVSVVRFRRGKVVSARDYFFDPTVEEAIWGRREEAHAA